MKENNTSKVNESAIDFNNLAANLNESSSEKFKEMLEEQVRQAYINILNESDEEDDKDYDVEEVDDTTEPVEDAETEDDANEVADDETSVDDSEDGTELEGEDNSTDTVDGEDETPVESETEVEVETEPEGEDEISQDFDKYKVDGEDNEYDFRDAEDDELVKVYKRLKDTDGVTVVKDGDKVEIKDSEAGTEYLIDMNSDDDASDMITDDNNTDDMNESRIFEIALNEYDSHVGYTDNYQKKDVMTNNGVSEPSKNGRDIDKGVNKTAQKPWSKEKKSVAPFNKGTKATNECGAVADTEAPVDETMAKMGATGRMMGVKSHRSNSGDHATNPQKQHVTSVAGEYKGSTNEAVEKKLNKIVKENQSLKAKLNDVTKMLQEAAVVNVNLGGIIKLITENSTTKDEKHEIVNRFTNEAHTIQESKTLYTTIANELQKKPQTTVNINEEKEFGKQEIVNESKLYQDENLMESLGLMHKICK